MSSSVQAVHSSSTLKFHTIHPQHNYTQYQELTEMTPIPNSDDHIVKTHPVIQLPVTTSRQVSQESDRTHSRRGDNEGAKNPKDIDFKEIPSGPSFDSIDESSLATSPKSCDRHKGTDQIAPWNSLTSSSTNMISTPRATKSSSYDKTNTADDIRSTTCTLNNPPLSHDSHSPLQRPPPSYQTGTERGIPNDFGVSSSAVLATAISHSTTSPSAISTHCVKDRSTPTAFNTLGTKRKMPLNDDEILSLTVGASQNITPISYSLPEELRNKKMKATDCLLFAATLLEQDVAEALVEAGTTPRTNKVKLSHSNSDIPAIRHEARSPASPSPPVKRAKPMKKMVCEKIEKSLQEIALQKEHQRKQQEHQQEQERHEGMDCENKPKDADVLCGRGGKVNKHPGNIVYRKVVEYNKSYYQSVHKKHRILVSQSIVKAILNYGGRFMGQKGKEWTPICFKRAVQKTSQALRERSNSSDVPLQGVL